MAVVLWDFLRPGISFSKNIGKLSSSLRGVDDCCSKSTRLVFDLYMFIENRLGSDVIFLLVSVMASRGPL